MYHTPRNRHVRKCQVRKAFFAPPIHLLIEYSATLTNPPRPKHGKDFLPSQGDK